MEEKYRKKNGKKRGKNYLITPLSLRKKNQKTDMHKRLCISTVIKINITP